MFFNHARAEEHGTGLHAILTRLELRKIFTDIGICGFSKTDTEELHLQFRLNKMSSREGNMLVRTQLNVPYDEQSLEAALRLLFLIIPNFFRVQTLHLLLSFRTYCEKPYKSNAMRNVQNFFEILQITC